MILFFLSVYLIGWLFVMVRVPVVATARRSIILQGLARKLPGFDASIFHPRYFHLWTKAQWVAWVEAQP